ncbi:MAG: hypothetical protein GY770_16480, partial [Aestuariibacter sp.]|nr:hypothetical protein [Aestuariibacter sp.]
MLLPRKVVNLTSRFGSFETVIKAGWVHTLDLNLWCYEYVIELIRTGTLQLTPPAFERIGTDTAGLLIAVDVFKGRDPDA